jgi:formate hydrogenlyase subunit 3/multisubunit Na+/H+ antiporter MnhD subunit
MASLAIALVVFGIVFPLLSAGIFAAVKREHRGVKNLIYAVQTLISLIAMIILLFNLEGSFSFAIFFLTFNVTYLLVLVALAVVAANFLIMFYNIGHGYSGSITYDIFMCVLLSSLIGGVFASDLITNYIFLDLALFSAGYLIFSIKNGTRAAYQFTFMNFFASILILFSILLFSAYTGGFSIERLAVVHGYENLVIFGLLTGLLIKVGAVPFHLWVSSAYSESAVPVAAILAGAANCVGLLMLYKIMPIMSSTNFLAIIGVITAVYASIVSINQHTFKKRFAYFSIVETGFIIYAFSLGSPEAIAGGFILLITQIFVKPLLFLFSGLVTEEHGLLKKVHNFALFGLITGSFSISGIPITGGFFGKYLVLYSAYLARDYLSIALLLSASFFVLVSFLLSYEKISALKQEEEPHFTTLLAMLILSIIIVLIGLVPLITGSIWTL